MPDLTQAEVAALASAAGLPVTPDDLVEVTHRLNAFLEALAPLAALEAVLRAEGWKSEPGAGVAAAVAHYSSAEGPRELTASALA